MNYIKLIILLAVITFSFPAQAQNKKAVEWITWTLTQAVPSPVFFQDRNYIDARLQFGFRWHISPLNYSFNANKLVSSVSFFKVNPVRRYGGSVEIFADPEWTISAYKLSDLSRFNLGTGVRGYIPIAEYGEYLSLSLGAKYNIRESKTGTNKNTAAAEVGIYTFFGIFGLKFDYNFSSDSRYNISLNLKYY